VLERFVRLDESRTTPGIGLGLPLVKAICHLHDAVLELGDNSPGLLVRVRFPVTIDENRSEPRRLAAR
jgi:signal transduction histidine kinase